MNKQNTFSQCKSSYIMWFIVSLLMTSGFKQVQAQTFELQGREYRQLDGVWYNFANGRQGDRIVPQRLIIRLHDRSDVRIFDLEQAGFSQVNVVSGELFGGYYVVEVTSPHDPFVIALKFSKNPLFDYVEFDALGEYYGTPNDPLYSNQWHLPKIQMPQAWDINTGCNSIILAVIDSGTDYGHEDLDGNIWVNPAEDFNGNGRADFYPYYVGGDLDWSDNDNNGKVDDLVGWDFQDNDNDPSDTYYHGTMVAGVALAQTNNYENGTYLGVAGAAGGWAASQGVLFMSLRVENGQPLLSQATEAITYAAGNGARVINMSFGFGVPYAPMEAALNNAADNYNCVLVAAAGNYEDIQQSQAISYPAAYDKVIAVGATTENDVRKELYDGSDEPNTHTWGSCYSYLDMLLDVMAPGVHIQTTDIAGDSRESSGELLFIF
ncbi:MAG: S8 family serine peptidase [Candidatus Marinimicrobia bacterium]|nr:S8 family serine peptidase [Candidatus Neomarinimicrobiota bacterium]